MIRYFYTTIRRKPHRNHLSTGGWTGLSDCGVQIDNHYFEAVDIDNIPNLCPKCRGHFDVVNKI